MFAAVAGFEPHPSMFYHCALPILCYTANQSKTKIKTQLKLNLAFAEGLEPSSPSALSALPFSLTKNQSKRKIKHKLKPAFAEGLEPSISQCSGRLTIRPREKPI